MNHQVLHYCSIGLIAVVPALGVGIGQGIASMAAARAINRQPAAQKDIGRIFLIGMAFTETAAIISFLIGMLLLTTPTTSINGWAQLGIAAALAIPGFVIGIGSALPVAQSMASLARQPFFGTKIMNLMLINQSVIQTPVIFGLIMGIIIYNQIATSTTLVESIKLLAAGLAMGLGSLGPTIGLSIFSQEACKSPGINRTAYPKIVSFTFVSQALIETPILFALIIAIMLTFIPITAQVPLIAGSLYLATACIIGFSTLGAGISSGRTAVAACKQITLKPEHYNVISRTSMLGQTLIDTCTIYGLILALILMFTRALA